MGFCQVGVADTTKVCDTTTGVVMKGKKQAMIAANARCCESHKCSRNAVEFKKKKSVGVDCVLKNEVHLAPFYTQKDGEALGATIFVRGRGL